MIAVPATTATEAALRAELVNVEKPRSHLRGIKVDAQILAREPQPAA
jgi:hypothetical protein